MGLDNYFENTDPSAPPMGFEPRLCGGMFSEHGKTSFRGKVYSEFVEFVTGETLYQDCIDNATLKDMAIKLRNFYNEYPNSVVGDFSIKSDELLDLVRVFEYHGLHGSELRGWW